MTTRDPHDEDVVSSPLLLTWNPGRDDDRVYDPRQWLTDVVEPCLGGRPVPSTWGVGRHRTGIGPGRVALLHRQGAHGRGLVARGSVTSEVRTGERTRTPGRITNYVEVVWTEAVPVELRLDVADVQTVTPDFDWRHVYSSGRSLPVEVGVAVLAEWDAHLAHRAVLEGARRLLDDGDSPVTGG